MRIAHLADLHLGFRQYHRVTPTGINQREADVAATFVRALDAVIALEPDVVLIAGDVFHTVRPMNPAIIHAFAQFARLRQALPSAAIVVVAGNHDQPRATETGCILSLFSQLGIHVVWKEPRRLHFPELELSVLAVPDLTGAHPELVAERGVRHNVLLLHGEIEGVLPAHLARLDRAGIEIPKRALHAEQWSYVALGHYHVHREIAPNAFYSGSIDYTSANPWGEMVEERTLGVPGKGFVEWDTETRRVTFHPLPPARALVDLPPVQASGMSAAEVDAAIAERAERVPGGIDDKIVRLVMRDVPRHVVRDLDHRAIRELKRRALNFHLDPRRPEPQRMSSGGAPGRRPTLPETVKSYLARRPLDSDIDREALVKLGLHYLAEVEAAEQAVPSPAAGT